MLLVLFALSFFLRVFPRLDLVFADGWVCFGEVDPWYRIRLIENLLHHFPDRIAFELYSFLPHGMTVQFAPLFDLIIGAGHPTQHTMEVVAVCFPAVMGALMVFPVFFIGKSLFNSKVGLISAALVLVLPGNFLARSLLVITDQHIAEVFSVPALPCF